jgi:hypothetical protein
MKQTAQKNGMGHVGNSIAHAVSKNAAQLKKQAPATGIGFTQQPVQLMLDTTDGNVDLPTNMNEVPQKVDFNGGGATKTVTIRQMTGTTSPADPVGMDNWRDGNYIKDPSKVNR